MNNASIEFNKQLELDVLVNNLTEVTREYVNEFDVKDRLDDIVIPTGVKSIQFSAFAWCNSLLNVTISEGVTEIWGWAFDSCSHLRNLTIPDTVTVIGRYAFNWCNRLTSVTIGKGVKLIGPNAFCQCLCLKNVTFKGKTLDEVRSMEGYPWDVSPENINVQDD